MKRRAIIWMLLLAAVALAALPAAAQSPSTNTVSYNGFSFSYDSSLNGQVVINQAAGDDPTVQQPGGPEVQHVEFSVSGAQPAATIDEAPLAIRVYNTSDFNNYPNQTAQFQMLQKLFGDKADLNTFMTPAATNADSSLPFIPIMPASQAIRARAQYVETPSVRGISYITIFRQDVSPFLGNEFVYTFQGFSIDGIHYVSAIFKLDTGLFPAQAPANFDANTFNDYLKQSVTTLNGAQPTDFTPSLAIFDAVIQSFSFEPGSTVAQTTPPSPATSTDPTFGGLTTMNWTLATYGPDEAPIPVLPEASINLVFTPEGISGSAGCNTYFGQFQYDVDKLSFSGIGSTEKACSNELTAQEAAYLQALQTATSYTINNGVLRITYRDGALTFNGGASLQATVTPVVGGNASLGGLAGVNWVLSSFGPAAAPVAVQPGTTVTAVFAPDGVAGNAGCNQYSGPFTYDNANITFSPLITTKVACDQPIMDQETAYLTALQSATSYAINNGQLQITYPEGVLTFNAGTSTAPTAAVPTAVTNTDATLGGLGGVAWKLASFGPTAAPIAVLPNAPINVDFTQQGVSGSSGCNQYSGTFTYDNGILTFSPLVSTQMACDQAVMDQEAAYLKALQTATGFQIVNNQLVITYPEGQLVFTAS